MNAKQFTCRFCLASVGKSVNLFDHDLLKNVNLPYWICLTFGLKLDETDDLPKEVCVSCMLVVYQTYFFIRKCRQSEDLLFHKSKSNAGAECIISSTKSGTKSNLSGEHGLRDTVCTSSTSAMHLLEKNKECHGEPPESVTVSLDLPSTSMTCDCLLTASHGLNQKNRIFENTSRELCLQCFQKRQQKLRNKFASRNSEANSLNRGVNSGDTQLINAIKAKPDHHRKSGKSTHVIGNLVEYKGRKEVDCLQNRSSCFGESENEECSSTANVEVPTVPGNGATNPATSDVVPVIELRHDKPDNKSAFHLEFVKFLNSNVPKPNFVKNMTKEIEYVSIKKESLLQHGIKSQELLHALQGEGNNDASRDLPDELVPVNPISIGNIKFEPNEPQDHGNEIPSVLPNFDLPVINISNDSVASTVTNADNNVGYSEYPSIVAVNDANNKESDCPPKILESSLKDNNNVFLQSCSDEPSGKILSSNIEKYHISAKEKDTSHKISSLGVTSPSFSPQENNAPSIGLKFKRSIEKAQLSNGSGCLKTARYSLEQNHPSVVYASQSEKDKKLPRSPSFSNLASSTTMKSPLRSKKFPVSSKIQSDNFKMLVTNVYTLSENEHIDISSSKPGISHLDHSISQEGQVNWEPIEERASISCEKYRNCVVKASNTNSKIVYENEFNLPSHGETLKAISNNLKIVTMANVEQSVEVIPYSPANDEMSHSINRENLQIQEDTMPRARDTSNELKFFKHKDGIGIPVDDITEKAIQDENEVSMVENSGSSELVATSVSDDLILSSGVTCELAESSAMHISNHKKGISVCRSENNISKTLNNHNPHTITPKTYPWHSTEAKYIDAFPSMSTEAENNSSFNSFSKPSQNMNKRKNIFVPIVERKNKKLKVNQRTSNNDQAIIHNSVPCEINAATPKILNIYPYFFPCPRCFKGFPKHDLLLKHLRVHSKPKVNASVSSAHSSQLEGSFPKSQVEKKVVNRPVLAHQDNFVSRTFKAVGLREETVDAIRSLIQHRLAVYGSDSLSSESKSFRCPDCFKLLHGWFEMASHIVQKHPNLSSMWPFSYLFSMEKFFQLTGKYVDGSTSFVGIVPQKKSEELVIQPLHVCELCQKQFSCKSALIKHMIWAHNQLPKL